MIFIINCIFFTQNGGGHKGDSGHYDMSVKGAWDMGYSGKNIVVTILDDGIERSHTDLIDNYVSNKFMYSQNTVTHVQ